MRSGLPSLAVGLIMLVAGFIYPGSHATVATSLIVFGSGMVALAIVPTRFLEFELGPAGLKTKMADAAPSSWIPNVRDDKLTRFALLVTGDSAVAQELVEEALARSRQRRRRLSAAERDEFTLRTLIALMETATERRWLRGRSHGNSQRARQDVSGNSAEEIIRPLQQLSFLVRVAFLLRTDWPLADEQVSTLMGISAEEVREALDTARRVLAPHIGSTI